MQRTHNDAKNFAMNAKFMCMTVRRGMLITENCNYFNNFIEVKFKRKYSAEVTLCKYMLQERRKERHEFADNEM